MPLYVIYLYTPSALNPDGTLRLNPDGTQADPGKKVITYWVGTLRRGDMLVQDWDEQRKYAYRFTNKIEAKKIQSKLRVLLGSENCKIKCISVYVRKFK